MEQANILALAERCRRLARETSDGQMRNSLEALAEDYESQLPPAARGTGSNAAADGDDDSDGGGFKPRTRH
ncbi:MAG: hypothetical protein ABIW33_01635 [Sphingomicrobium sp.]